MVRFQVSDIKMKFRLLYPDSGLVYSVVDVH